MTNKPTELVVTQEQQEAELGLLYNYTKDDSPQFTRWQMMTAIAHGYRLASTAPASEDEVEIVSQAIEPETFLLTRINLNRPV